MPSFGSKEELEMADMRMSSRRERRSGPGGSTNNCHALGLQRVDGGWGGGLLILIKGIVGG